MEFAKRILNKYGWKDGDGLGKNNDGIVKPVKARYKFDTAGLGQNEAASDYNNHWWERVFNEAAQNMEVQNEESGDVSMNIKGDVVEITTKGYSMKKLRNAKRMAGVNGSKQYGNFLQQTTLTKAGYEVEDPEKTDLDISMKQFKTLTDEELFQACGGRTAHKAARHGLKLSGKLSRLEQQDREFLKNMQMKFNENQGKTSEIKRAGKDKEKVDNDKLECTSSERIVKKKKKSGKRKAMDSFVDEEYIIRKKRETNVNPGQNLSLIANDKEIAKVGHQKTKKKSKQNNKELR